MITFQKKTAPQDVTQASPPAARERPPEAPAESEAARQKRTDTDGTERRKRQTVQDNKLL